MACFRSNSYGRSEENSFNDTTYDIYLHDDPPQSAAHAVEAITGRADRLLFDPSSTASIGGGRIVSYDPSGGSGGQDNRVLHDTTNLEAAFSSNAARAGSKAARDFDSFSCETPPGYEESIYRQRLLKLQGRPVSYIGVSPVRSSPAPRGGGSGGSPAARHGNAPAGGGRVPREIVSGGSPAPRPMSVPGEVLEKQV